MDTGSFEHIPILQGLPKTIKENLAKRSEVVDLAMDTMLIEEGKMGNSVYFILSGDVEVIKALGSPDERSIATRQAGDFVGELSVINPNGRAMASVRTKTTVRLLKLTGAEFISLISHVPEIAHEIITVLGGRLTEAHSKTIEELHAKNERLSKAYADLKAAQADLIEKERLDRELELAHDIQMSVVPESLPTLDGFEIAGLLHTAREVGGDFFDVVALDSDRISILVGDVTDKGVPAALFMSRAHALFRAEALRSESPVQILKQVNRHLMDIGSETFPITVLLGIVSKSNRVFHYARAGHELPIHTSQNGPNKPVPLGDGQPLGFFEDPLIDEQRINIEPGDRLLIFSDGAIDGRNEHGDYYGMKRFLAAVEDVKQENAKAICDNLWKRQEKFQGQRSQDDDFTLVVIQSNT